MANHHDNFDNFDSTYQPWNSRRKSGQKERDIVGGWAREEQFAMPVWRLSLTSARGPRVELV